MEGNLIIRTFQHPRYEEIPMYVGIDSFRLEEIGTKNKYIVSLQVYDRNGKIIHSPRLDSVAKSRYDIFSKPNMTMYVSLGMALKANGKIFNKKRGILKTGESTNL